MLPGLRVFDVFGTGVGTTPARMLPTRDRWPPLSRLVRRANYFLDFCRLREALTDLVMISPSVLPKA
jgi:hypothetical protein